MPSASVVIVNWNAGALLPACIASLERQVGLDLVEIIVVDNASTDESTSVLGEMVSAGRIAAIFNEGNLGFARANNIGLAQATGSTVIFLNPDTEFLEVDGVARLVAEVSDPRVGLVGPHLRNIDGSTQSSCAAVPSIWSTVATGFGLHLAMPDAARRRLAPVVWSQQTSTETGWLRGACLGLRAETARTLGGFSEATFMYAEDLDLAYRVSGLGLTVRYVADVNVLHVDDYSSSQRWSDAEKSALSCAADVTFLKQHYARPREITIRILMAAAYAVRGAVYPLIGRSQRARSYRRMARAVLTRRSVRSS